MYNIAMTYNNSADPVAAWLRSKGVNELTVARLQRAARARGLDNEAFLHEIMDYWSSAPEAVKGRARRLVRRRSVQAAKRTP
jgi:hypothetical protein